MGESATDSKDKYSKTVKKRSLKKSVWISDLDAIDAEKIQGKRKQSSRAAGTSSKYDSQF